VSRACFYGERAQGRGAARMLAAKSPRPLSHRKVLDLPAGRSTTPTRWSRRRRTALLAWSTACCLRTWRRWPSACCRCSYDAAVRRLLVGEWARRLPELYRACKKSKSMTQVPSRETRQGYQTRVDAGASLSANCRARNAPARFCLVMAADDGFSSCRDGAGCARDAVFL
jgi:hypothetical protein